MHVIMLEKKRMLMWLVYAFNNVRRGTYADVAWLVHACNNVRRTQLEK